MRTRRAFGCVVAGWILSKEVEEDEINKTLVNHVVVDVVVLVVKKG